MTVYRRLVLGTARLPPVERMVAATRPGRQVVRSFVAGETLDEAVAVTRRLMEGGFAVSLDHLGEEVVDEGAALAARDEYLACLDRLAGLDANVSLKLTQLGLAFDPALAARCLDDVARAAAAVGTTVTVDMEGSRHTTAILDTYSAAQAVHGNLGVAVQAALRRTPADLDRIRSLGGHVRLCKGAYLEPPDVAFRRRRDVQAAFANLLGDLMSTDEPRPAVATHDEILLALTAGLARRREGPYEVQMLYGVRPDVQRRLLADGLPVRIYVPYGSAWYPYLTRRMAERPANLVLFLRALPRALGGMIEENQNRRSPRGSLPGR